MEKTDLKEVLKEDKKNTEEKKIDTKINVHKKPMQLRDIESRSSTSNKEHKIETPENMKKLLNEEKNQIFKQPWNRLDTGMKLNRIRLFSETFSKENNLNKTKQEEVRKLLVDHCRANKLNKTQDVNYDKEKCMIISIKNLSIKDGKILFITNDIKKAKKTTKTKSHLDRLLTKKI